MKRPYWLILLVIPMIVLALNEWLSVRETENAFKVVMDRQSNTILFSFNQQSWDIATSWTNTYSLRAKNLVDGDTSGMDALKTRNQTVCLWFASKIDQPLVTYGDFPETLTKDGLERILSTQSMSPNSLITLYKQQYRKLEPITGLPDGLHGLWSVHETEPDTFIRIGFLYEASTFIANEITPMLQAAASDNVTIGVFKGPTDSLIVATSTFTPKSDDPRNALWLFNDTWLVIDMKDGLYSEHVQGRLRRSIALLLFACGLIAIALVLIFRSVQRQTQLAQMKTDFVANVSHELRTPVSLIRLFSETLEMDRVVDEQKKREYYRIIRSESERLGFLIGNILDYSKMEAGKKKYDMHFISINEIVLSVMSTYSYNLESYNFKHKLDLDKSNPIIEADEDAIKELIVNLIENAIKYSRDKKFISIRTRAAVNGDTRLEVADHGIGIAPEHHERIFEAFYRVESSMTAQTRGTGLGLSIVKRIVDSHNATLFVDSELGKGSAFIITFPSLSSKSNKQPTHE